MNSKPWHPPTLETARLILRPLTEKDAPGIFQYASDPEVSRWTLWEPHRSLEDSLTFVRDYAFPSYARKEPEPFGLFLKSEPSIIIGTAGCFHGSEPSAARTMELGYALATRYWGQGLMVEAMAEIIDWVLAKRPEIERIQARCKTQNGASARVMEKLGMRREGTLRHAAFHRDQYWDVHLYAMLRSDWKKP
jgi:ribosomal-protein-alanine N-acetyltransferase